MFANELAAKLRSLSADQRQVVESLINLLSTTTPPARQPDLTNHPSFGGWSKRRDLPKSSDTAARELRKRVGRRESA